MLSDAFIKNAQPLSDDFSAILVDARKIMVVVKTNGRNSLTD
jgi:hypothetical protein